MQLYGSEVAKSTAAVFAFCGDENHHLMEKKIKLIEIFFSGISRRKLQIGKLL